MLSIYGINKNAFFGENMWHSQLYFYFTQLALFTSYFYYEHDKKNVTNKLIDKIYLLNERIYTDNELDISSNKISQISIDKRLQFSFDAIPKFPARSHCDRKKYKVHNDT